MSANPPVAKITSYQLFTRDLVLDEARLRLDSVPRQAAVAAGAGVTIAQGAYQQAADALALAGHRTTVFKQNTPPTNPQAGYALRDGDIWYDTTEDANGRIAYRPYEWTAASGWSLMPPQRVLATEVVTAELSALSANLGTVTAGLMEKTASGKTTTFDLTNQRIVFDNGTVVKATGVGFGTSNQFVEWVGLRAGILSGGAPSLALCSEANAIQYIKTDGSAFFKGTLNVGTISTSGQTSDTSATAEVTVGPVQSLGGAITIPYSLTSGGEQDYFSAGNTPGTYSYSVTYGLALERSIGGAAWTTVATQTVNGTQSKEVGATYYNADLGISGQDVHIITSVSGSYTTTNTPGATADVRYRLRITSRTFQAGAPGVHTGFTQRLALTTQE